MIVNLQAFALIALRSHVRGIKYFFFLSFSETLAKALQQDRILPENTGFLQTIFSTQHFQARIVEDATFFNICISVIVWKFL